jgi:hypothetical protein
MSVSTQAAPRQIGFGRFPMALAMLALVIVIAAAVALVALNGSKAAAPAALGAKGAPPPAVIDHGWSNGETVILPKTTSQFGGWAGPRLVENTYVAPSTLERTKDNTFGGRRSTGGGHNGTRFAQ